MRRASSAGFVVFATPHLPLEGDSSTEAALSLNEHEKSSALLFPDAYHSLTGVFLPPPPPPHLNNGGVRCPSDARNLWGGTKNCRVLL